MKIILALVFVFSIIPSSAQTIDRNKLGFTEAIAFVNSLSSEQKQKALFDFEQMNRYEWHFFPASMVPRVGIAIKDLNTSQKDQFYKLLKSFLSSRGYNRTRDIMSFEYILRELEPTNPNRIPENYYAAFYGSPERDSIWGWKYSGHHVDLNFTIVNGKLAFAPFFFGVNPGEVKQGPKKGIRLIKEEEDLGFELIGSFNQEQKQKAIFQLKAFTEIVTSNAQKVAPLGDVGIEAGEMSQGQKTLLNKLIQVYLSSMPPEIARLRMQRVISEDMETIKFGWAGSTIIKEPHYYRIQGKTFLIEFDNTQNNANHIHTVWRDFNGDFGADLLREHYLHSHHK